MFHYHLELTALLALAALCCAEKLSDKADYAFNMPKMSRPAPRILTTKLHPHIGALPPFLMGATVEMKVAYYKKGKSLGGRLSVMSPVLGTIGTGWLEGKSVTGTLVSVVHLYFANRGIKASLFMRGDPSWGFTGMGTAMHCFMRPAGVVMVRSKTRVADGVKALQDALNGNPNGPRLIATIDHAAAAERVGLALAPSTVVVFGRPQIGAPLWRQQAEIGIELPMEVLVAESPLGVGYVAYNSAHTLATRFNVNIAPGLPKGLANFARIAAGLDELAPEAADFDSSRVRFLAGIIQKSRTGITAAAAYKNLIDALEAAEPVGIAYAIEHDESAVKAGIEVVSENKVAVFGNPMIGTPLMQSSFTAALDLPAKMGVWDLKKGENKAYVGYVQPDWIADRHMAEKQSKLTAALEMFSNKALGN